MKKQLIILFQLMMITNAIGQFSTGVRGLAALNTNIKIDTTPTTVTMTLNGNSTRWLGIGFGGNTMATTTDMFIWNDTADRDYTLDTSSNSGHNMPLPDADQSWTIVSDTVIGGIRTIVATRPLVSAGDYTFLNNSSFIQILFAQGDTTTLAYHGTSNVHNSSQITRFFLALEDFSIDAPSLYPNPTKGNFIIKSKTCIDAIKIYSQTGAVVKTIAIEIPKEENEINVSDLASGMYIVELQNGEQKSYKNLIVE